MVRKQPSLSHTLQGRIRPLFPRGSSYRSTSSTERTVKENSSLKEDSVDSATVRQRALRKVHFAEELVQREALSVEPLTKEEKKECYYNEEDLYRFDRDRGLTALSYRRKKDIGIYWDDNHNDSIRGLEEGFRKESENRDNRRRQVMKVLTTQKQERLAGRQPCPDVLREVATKASKENRHRAVVLAKEDSVAAGTRHRHAGNKNPSPIVVAAKKVQKSLHLWRTASPPP